MYILVGLGSNRDPPRTIHDESRDANNVTSQNNG